MSTLRNRHCRYEIIRSAGPDTPPPGNCRIAVFGGDARQRQRWAQAGQVRFFQSRRGGGNGELRRLVAAVRAGAVDRVVVLTRWNGHSATRKLRRVCRGCGVDLVLVP